MITRPNGHYSLAPWIPQPICTLQTRRRVTVAWLDELSLAVRRGDIFTTACEGIVCPVTVSLDG